MNLSAAQWHDRYLQQAKWTAALREYIFKQIGFNGAGSVLEVGCGTSAVLSTLPGNPTTTGLDIQYSTLEFSNGQKNKDTTYINADASCLPLADGMFDITYCHYLLLWLKTPLDTLREMKRVTRLGGTVIAFAEPDHAGRIDYPPELADLGKLQSRALEEQGVNLMAGRQLARLFAEAGLTDIVSGVSGFQRQAVSLPDWFDSEWQMLEHDLAGKVSAAELAHFRSIDEHAWTDGSRVLWVPTFYAFGKV
jgi:ubiquinone/menaquinone biosynthesis C-methylase UbiE